jgi:hypothetical protein
MILGLSSIHQILGTQWNEAKYDYCLEVFKFLQVYLNFPVREYISSAQNLLKVDYNVITPCVSLI